MRRPQVRRGSTRRSGRRPRRRPRCSIEARLGEDHPSGDRLQDPGDRDVDVPVDVSRAALDHDHRAVVEEADALAGLLALLDDPHPELLARQDRRLDRVRERVDVHDPDALQLGHAVEVEVVGQDDPAPRPGQRHELGIDLGDVGDVVLDDLDGRRRLLLHPGQDLQAAPSAVASERVRAVGDVLELVEHEPRDHERPVDEPGLDDLGDPAVDDRAGVDDDVRIADRRRRRSRRSAAAGRGRRPRRR